jgi:hypothetical protein
VTATAAGLFAAALRAGRTPPPPPTQIAPQKLCTTCGQPSKYEYRETEYDRVGLAAKEWLSYACVEHRRTVAPEGMRRGDGDCGLCTTEHCSWPACRTESA